MTALSDRKTALVTGGNRGIGFAICQGLLNANWNVVLGSRSLENGKTAARQFSAAEAQVEVLALDVADDVSIEQAVQTFSQRRDRLDVLINNAGIYPDAGVNILSIDRELLTKTLNTNTVGAICVTQAFLPFLEKADEAQIINYSSGYGQLAGLSANVPSYCLSKLALNGATLMLAEALRPQIAVHAVDPGWVHTDMGGAAAPRTPEQGADTAVWLATQSPPKPTGKLWRDRSVVSY